MSHRQWVPGIDGLTRAVFQRDIGSVVPAASGATVTLRGQVYLDTGATLTKLRLIRNGSYVCDLTGPTWSKAVSTTSDCYYRVELVTSGGRSYTNPIYLNVP